MSDFDAHLILITITEQGRIISANTRFSNEFGYQLEQLLDLHIEEDLKIRLSNEQSGSSFSKLLSIASESVNGEFVNASLKHKYHYPIDIKANIKLSESFPNSFDIRIFETLNNGADSLTKLANGWAITSQFDYDLAQQQKMHTGYILFEIDKFSSINFRYGYKTGDQYLIALGKKLTSLCESSDLVVRYSNARFGILIRDFVTDKFSDFQLKFQQLVNQLMDLSKHSIVLDDGIEINKCFSLGVSSDIRSFKNFFELDTATEHAFHISKSCGETSYTYTKPEFAQELIVKKHVIDKLPNVIEHCSIDVHYQPQYELISERLIGFEALARWEIDEIGLIPPVHFVSTAESLGLNVEFDLSILTKVCQQINYWQSIGLQVPLIAVNMSAKSLESANLVERIITIIEKQNCPKDLIEIEITETSQVNNIDLIINNLIQLKRLGLSFAMDDFGAGYSSLNLLRMLDGVLDKLKLDIKLTEMVCAEEIDKAFLEQIIGLGKILNVQILAEGIETEQQKLALIEMGCEFAQGYYFNPPLTALNAEKLL